MIDKLGSPETYNHYPTGWAVAFSTPFKMFKRYSYQGGVCDPLAIHWPAGIKAKGEVRSQYHHAVDIVPTIMEACGVELPQFVNGYEQTPIAGVSMRYSFDDADAPTTKREQYYSMLGTRAIWQDGWKAVAVHGALLGTGGFDHDEWELYHAEEDRSEAHDLAKEHPDKLEDLIRVWFEEAGKYDVLPLDDRTALEVLTEEKPAKLPPGGTYTYYPETSEIPERSAADTHGRSYRILADVELTPDSEGVIMAHGARFGGHSLFVKDGKLYYVYNFLGIPPEQQFVSDALPAGRHVLGVDFRKESVGKYFESHGTTRLHVDDKVVAEGPMRSMTGHFSLCGEGLCIGRDSADPVSKEYGPQFPFTNGTIHKVEISIGDDQYVDLEVRAAAAMARD
jgi:arylsulfatase